MIDTNLCSSVSDTFFAYRITVNAGNDTTFCKGQQVTLGGSPTASAAAGTLLYEWHPAFYLSDTTHANPIATPVADICYELIARNSFGNNAIDTVCIHVLPLPAPLITQQGNTLHSNYANGNQWYFNGQSVANATGESIAITEEGPYAVRVTDNAGCSSLSPVYYATLTQLQVVVYPSHVTNTLHIQYNLPEADAVTMEIFNIGNGTRKLVSEHLPQYAGIHVMEINSLYFSKGTYLIRITTSNGKAITKFIVP